MSKEALGAIDEQIISWIEQLDELYEQRKEVNMRIVEIESRLSSMKRARTALALEWRVEKGEISIPLKYTTEGVTDAIHDIFRASKEDELNVNQIVSGLMRKGFDFGEKNPRRVVNMALINDPEVESDGKGGYTYEELPF